MFKDLPSVLILITPDQMIHWLILTTTTDGYVDW